MILIKTDFLNAIEKALRGSQRDNHKYIFRREVAEKTSGKSVRRYEYVYEEDRKLHPLEMLKKFFGISQKEVDADYEKGNIQKDFGADKPTFAQHLLEYFCHRSIWDKRFAKKDNQDKFKKPVKMQTFKETASTVSKDMETPEAESTEPSLFSDKELKKNKIELLPATLQEAVREAEADPLIREALGDHVFNNYIEGKKREWEEYSMQITNTSVTEQHVSFCLLNLLRDGDTLMRKSIGQGRTGQDR